MEFRILGPLEVLDDGRVVDVGAAKQRALLAVLLLNANHVVSSDELLEAL
jgi:DNA-binding SARP family transcriptional activator